MIEKNQEFNVQITGVGSEGQGVARHENMVVFVPYALLGEEVMVHIIKVASSYAVGKIMGIIKPSNSRISPPCPYFYKCGGCQLQHANGEAAVEIKHKIVQDALDKIGGFKNVDVKNVIKSERLYNYRNKSAFPITIDEDGKIRVCMFRQQSHSPIFIDKCLLASDDINKAIVAFMAYANGLENPSDVGFKFLVVRSVAGKMLVTIVSQKRPPSCQVLFDKLIADLNLGKQSLGLFWCKKDIENNVILEGELKHLLGASEIDANILGVQVCLTPMSFFQLNLGIMQQIYKAVASQFDKSFDVVDAYSGAGLMSALVSKEARNVFAIEIVREACEDAKELAKRNRIGNMQVICGDVSAELPKLKERLKGNVGLILDPPRKGVDKRVLQTILEFLPKKILYVSCSPQSLARDLKALGEKYIIAAVQPYDMFPQTCHVECVVTLELK